MNNAMKACESTQWVVIVILFLTFGSVMLDRMAPLYLGPHLVKELNLSASQIGMLAAATSICWAISALLFGAISDRLGRRPVLIPAVFAFSLCSVLSGRAQSFNELLLYRALLGLAEGPCWSVIMALAEEYSPPEHRARNIGIVNSAGVMAGGALAPVFTTQMAAVFGWQGGFYGAAVPGIVSGVLLMLFVKEPKLRLETGAVQKKEWFGDFVELLKYKNLWLSSIAGFGISIWVFCFTTFAPLYITSVMGQTPTMAGFLMGASGLGGFAWSFFGTGLADHIGRKRTLLLFALLAVVEPIVFMFPSMYGSPWLLAGVAFAVMTMPSAASLAMVLIPAESVPKRLVGAAIGFCAIGLDFVGATLAPLIGGTLGDAYGFSSPIKLAIGGALFVFAIGLLIRETHKRQPAVFESPAAVNLNVR